MYLVLTLLFEMLATDLSGFVWGVDGGAPAQAVWGEGSATAGQHQSCGAQTRCEGSASRCFHVGFQIDLWATDSSSSPMGRQVTDRNIGVREAFRDSSYDDRREVTNMYFQVKKSRNKEYMYLVLTLLFKMLATGLIRVCLGRWRGCTSSSCLGRRGAPQPGSISPAARKRVAKALLRGVFM